MVAVTLVGAGTIRSESPVQQGGPLLLARARRLTRTDGWQGWIAYTPEYRWISSHELLYFEGTVGDWKLTKLDIDTGVKTPLVGLTKAYNETLTGIGVHEVSPDGKRLLWASSRDEKPTWVVAKIDGSQRTEWRRLKVGQISSYDPFGWSFAYWTDNGRAVMETSLEAGRAWSSTLARLSIKGIEPATGSELLARTPWPSMTCPEPSAAERNVLLGIDDFATIQNRRNDDIRVFTGRLSKEGSSATAHIVHLPRYANFFGAVPSPGVDRIAWELGSPYDPTSRGVSGRASPPRKRLPLSFWVSRVDGSGLRPLGHLQPDRRGAVWQYEHLGGLRWTPDGKRLSFVYNGILYSVPAP
jgi:WD40-like Beta Propeller Repeat